MKALVDNSALSDNSNNSASSFVIMFLGCLSAKHQNLHIFTASKQQGVKLSYLDFFVKNIVAFTYSNDERYM